MALTHLLKPPHKLSRCSNQDLWLNSSQKQPEKTPHKPRCIQLCSFCLCKTDFTINSLRIITSILPCPIHRKAHNIVEPTAFVLNRGQCLCCPLKLRLPSVLLLNPNHLQNDETENQCYTTGKYFLVIFQLF